MIQLYTYMYLFKFFSQLGCNILSSSLCYIVGPWLSVFLKFLQVFHTFLSPGCKCYRLGSLNTKYYSSQFWRLRNPKSRCWQIQCLMRALPQEGCRWLPSCCILRWQTVLGTLVSSPSFKGTIPTTEAPPHGLT